MESELVRYPQLYRVASFMRSASRTRIAYLALQSKSLHRGHLFRSLAPSMAGNQTLSLVAH